MILKFLKNLPNHFKKFLFLIFFFVLSCSFSVAEEIPSGTLPVKSNTDTPENIEISSVSSPAVMKNTVAPAVDIPPALPEPTISQIPQNKPPVVTSIRNWVDIPVRMRSEDPFDSSGDRKIQANEAKAFLSVVLQATRNGGNYPVTSDILVRFDKNSDGVISPSEGQEISAFLN